MQIATICFEAAFNIIDCKLLTMFQSALKLNPNEPIKIVHLQKLANQPLSNNTLVILAIIFMKARNFDRVMKRETF